MGAEEFFNLYNALKANRADEDADFAAFLLTAWPQIERVLDAVQSLPSIDFLEEF